jgi:CBS domain-containing protein
MTPAARLVTADPDEPLADALRKLGTGNVGQLPVVREGRLLGVLVERDVARWLELESTTRRAPHPPAPRTA